MELYLHIYTILITAKSKFMFDQGCKVTRIVFHYKILAITKIKLFELIF